eukprot:Gb_35141 [translate_table: standard]
MKCNPYVKDVIHEVTQLYALPFKTECDSDLFLMNALLTTYAKYGRLGLGWQLFDKMPERDISWNAIIAGDAQNGQIEEPLNNYSQTQWAAWEQGKQVDVHVIKMGNMWDGCVGSTLVDIEDSRQVFDKMIIRDLEPDHTPKTEEIYTILEEVTVQIKEAGYLPDTNFVLRDVEAEQQEYSLYHHSEKLAIVFGLISIPPKIPIRIMKNLRLCGHCHTACKFTSKCVGREIVMRYQSLPSF